MKKIFLLLSICAFALCFSSFHNASNKIVEKVEKVNDVTVPPSFIMECLITSDVWHQTVKDMTSKYAQAIYSDYIGNVGTSETAAKRVQLAQKMLSSKKGDSYNLYLVSYFTTDNYLLTSGQIADLKTDLESAISNQFDALAGLAP